MTKQSHGKNPPSPVWVYARLLAVFGPQGWWPVVIKKRNQKDFFPQYHPGQWIRLTSSQAFEIAVGAILTQNTAWSNVEKALAALYLQGVMSPQKILSLDGKKLAALIRSSGYFTQKTKKLKILARFILDQAHGNILEFKKRPLERLRKDFLALWGVGPETADSILLYALDKSVFVIDAYTRRIGERLGWPLAKTEYDQYRKFFEAKFNPNVNLFQEFHALFVELAKRYCRKSQPLCGQCPLKSQCFFARKIKSE